MQIKIDPTKQSPEVYAKIWQQICSEGKKNTVFYAGDVKKESDFVDMALSIYCDFFLFMVGAEVAGVFWLNGKEGYIARIHHCWFKKYYRDCQELAHYGLEMLLNLERADGTPFVKTLYGMTPKSNRLGIKFLKRVGFQVVGELPDACFIAEEQRAEAGIVSFCNHETLLRVKE